MATAKTTIQVEIDFRFFLFFYYFLVPFILNQIKQKLFTGYLKRVAAAVLMIRKFSQTTNLFKGSVLSINFIDFF